MGNAQGIAAVTRIHVASDAKVKAALKAVSQEHEPLSLDRVLLNFPAINATLRKLRSVYAEFDTTGDGLLSHDEVAKMMLRLGAMALDKAGVESIFNAADVYSEGSLSYDEFVVCLCLGYVLRAIPLLEGGAAAGAAAAAAVDVAMPPLRRTASHFYGEGEQVQKAFRFAVQTYLIFDPDVTGSISREGMEQSLIFLQQNSPSKVLRKKRGEAGLDAGSHAGKLLAESRWREMFTGGDGSAGGRVTFSHFIIAFVGWVSTRDEDEEEEEKDEEKEGKQ